MSDPQTNLGQQPAYPPAAFAFRLQMVGTSAILDEAGFQEVSGLSVEMETKPCQEGGQNQFTHKVPNGAQGGTLVLKRGFLATEKPLYLWCEQILQGNLDSMIQPASFNLQLLSTYTSPGSTATSDILKSWSFLRAWPTKWEIAGFNSEESKVAVESLELSYSSVVRMPLPTTVSV